MHESRTKHLELVQAVISRMASNSFLVKGWSVTLVSALFALAAGGTDHRYAIVAYFPAVVFWVLDGYYLAQERQFRALFDAIRSDLENQADFCMDTKQHAKGRNTWSRAFFSRTLVAFHGAVIVTLLVVMVFLVPT